MSKNYRDLLTAVAIATSLITATPTAWAAADQISIETPWIRSAPPTATVLAGYMTIRNHSDTAIILTSATSPAFKTVQLHRTILRDGMMHMDQVKTVTIGAGKSLKLEPNSYHLMLNSPNQTIKTGNTIPLTLHFNGTAKQVTLIVQQDSEAEPHTHHH